MVILDYYTGDFIIVTGGSQPQLSRVSDPPA
jgi:hypothetical protein